MLDLSNPPSAASTSAPVGGPTPGAPTQRPISQSASGTTWSAFDATTPQAGAVTVKRFNIRFTDYLTRNPAALERLSRFEGRPVVGLPKLVRAGMAGGQLMLLSEGLSGESLDQICADHRRGFDVRAAVELIGQLARALDALHEGGLLHVDVRPAAIRVDIKRCQAQFADWGHAIPIEGLEMSLGAIPGIAMDGVPYASAELLAGMGPQPADDVFALACVAYEMLSGKHPFARRSAADALALGLVPAPLQNIDRATNDALMQALALTREGRRISMRAIAEAFNPKQRSYGLSASNALLRSAWNGSFTRGAAMGIALGAVIAASVMIFIESDPMGRARRSVAYAPIAGLEAASGRTSLPENRRSVIAPEGNTNDRGEAADRSASGSVPPGSSQPKPGAVPPPSAKTGQAPPRPAPDAVDLAEANRIAPLVLGQPLTGDQRAGEAPRSEPLVSPSTSDVTARAAPDAAPRQPIRSPANGGEPPLIARPSERPSYPSTEKPTFAQALASCPQCSCAALREKRFSEGKSLSWEEANFYMNVC